MRKIIVFTHIPKTAGTSFMHTVFRNNAPDARVFVFKGLKMFLRYFDAQRYDVIKGHIPYGSKDRKTC